MFSLAIIPFSPMRMCVFGTLPLLILALLQQIGEFGKLIYKGFRVSLHWVLCFLLSEAAITLFIVEYLISAVFCIVRAGFRKIRALFKSSIYR